MKFKFIFLWKWDKNEHGPGDLGSIPGRIIPKTLKMVLDTSLLNTQQYKVCIKGKVEHPTLYFGVVAIEKEAFWLPSTTRISIFFSQNVTTIMGQR